MATADLLTVAAAPTALRPVLFTAADLEHFPRELPTTLVEYELFDGVLVIMNRPTARHGGLQARLTAEFYMQGEKLGHGKVYTELGVLLKRNPDRVLGPDVSFYARSIIPPVESCEGYMETMPSLAVEIRSKNDSRPYVERKAQAYLEADVPLVWIVDSESRTVTIMRPNQPPDVLGEQQILTAEDTIPGFHLSLAELFRQ